MIPCYCCLLHAFLQAEQAHESYAKLRSKLDIYSVRKQELEAHCAVLEQRAAQVRPASASASAPGLLDNIQHSPLYFPWLGFLK